MLPDHDPTHTVSSYEYHPSMDRLRRRDPYKRSLRQQQKARAYAGLALMIAAYIWAVVKRWI